MVCSECGRELRPQSECRACGGEDPYGQKFFCPECEFCCGC